VVAKYANIDLIKLLSNIILISHKKVFNMKIFLVSAVALVALSTAVIASPNSQTGCGLGSLIIKDNSSAIMLALQATTNNTLGNQTFGITSGTLGCKKTKLVMNERAQEFVASNMDTLAKEIAVGHGETIDTLAELLKVKNSALFASNLQANYNSIYTSQKVEMSEVLDNISATTL